MCSCSSDNPSRIVNETSGDSPDPTQRELVQSGAVAVTLTEECQTISELLSPYIVEKADELRFQVVSGPMYYIESLHPELLPGEVGSAVGTGCIAKCPSSCELRLCGPAEVIIQAHEFIEDN